MPKSSGHTPSFLSVALFAAACEATDLAADAAGESEGYETESTETETEGDDVLDEQACHAALEKGPAKIGDACSTNDECESHVCETFQTVPPPGAGVCGETPSGCRSRIMGTVRDMVTSLPVVEANVSLMSGTDAAAGVSLARHLMEATSDDEGHIDTITDEPIDAFIGTLGLVEAEKRVPTATGLASPIDGAGHYEPCFALREWWTVSGADLATWNESLATDQGVAPHLPLDEAFDLVGFVRTFTHSPQPIVGAKLAPANAESNAVIRYLNEDGATFNDAQTTSAGIFVVFGATLGENFQIDAPGMSPWNTEAVRSGVFPDALWVMPLWMVPAQRGTMTIGSPEASPNTSCICQHGM